jgi:hypothetical protein
VLIVVEYRNSFEILETLFYFEAFWGLDVFQINGHEITSYLLDNLYLLLGVDRVNTEWNNLHSSQQLEEERFAFHHWQTSSGTDVA